jgi:hypothetical protein
MSQAEFDRVCEVRGFKPQGVLGYYGTPSGVHVSVLNLGRNPTRRAIVAYLHAQNDKHEKCKKADARNAERMDAITGGYRKGDPARVFCGEHGIRMELLRLTPEEAAAITMLLREVRS